jgi:hypothetical protein
MHKDAIILGSGFYHVNQEDTCWQKTENGIIPLLELLKGINPYHFCTIYIIIKAEKEQEITAYFTEHRKEYSFAISIVVEEKKLSTGGQIKKTLALCDTEDVIIFDGCVSLEGDIDCIIRNQEEKMADCTIAYAEKDIEFHSPIYLCLFKKGFLTLPFSDSFDFKTEYLNLGALHNHQIEKFNFKGKSNNYRW